MYVMHMYGIGLNYLDIGSYRANSTAADKSAKLHCIPHNLTNSAVCLFSIFCLAMSLQSRPDIWRYITYTCAAPGLVV